MYRMYLTAAVLSACTFVGSAQADIVDSFEIGSGTNTSSLIFQFTNGNQYLYEISYSEPMSGREAFDVIEAAQTGFFVADIVTFSFGDSLYGLTIGTDQDEGFGTEPEFLDYWHYWTKSDEASNWEFSSVGFSDRMLSDGSWDGYVFNSNFAPVPGCASLLAMTGIISSRRRRR